jgi:hypothetical protein
MNIRKFAAGQTVDVLLSGSRCKNKLCQKRKSYRGIVKDKGGRCIGSCLSSTRRREEERSTRARDGGRSPLDVEVRSVRSVPSGLVPMRTLQYQSFEVSRLSPTIGDLASDATTIPGDNIFAPSLRRRNCVGHSRFLHGWMCLMSAISRVGTHSISGIAETTVICHPPRRTSYFYHSSFRLYFTRGNAWSLASLC